MGKGLAFLNLKYWHPTNPQNRQRKWENEQKHKAVLAKAKERDVERKREEELVKMRRLIAQRSGADSEQYRQHLAQAPVSFMYAEPPGLKQAREKEQNVKLNAARVEEFRKVKANADLPRDQLRAMEKELEESMNPHERDVQRFAFLKNAPMKDEWCKTIEVHHKPFGHTIRNVKCFKCGQWGHRIGDRECKMGGPHPAESGFLDSLEPKKASTDTQALQQQKRTGSDDEWAEVEDVKPSAYPKAVDGSSKKRSRSSDESDNSDSDSGSRKKPKRVMDSEDENELHEGDDGTTEVKDYRGEFKMEDNVVLNNDQKIFGGFNKHDENQQMLASEDEDDALSDSSDGSDAGGASALENFAFLQHLTDEQKREWLREIEEDAKKKSQKKKKKKSKKKKRKKKKSKKKKKKRKKRSSSSDDSDSSDSSDSPRNKKKRRRR